MIEIPEFKFALRDDLKDRPEFLPTKANPTDTGWDVRCAEPDGVHIFDHQDVKIRLGFRAYCPAGFCYKLVPRSGTFTKKNLHCLYGEIDESYSFELLLAAQFISNKALFENRLNHSCKIEFGERIGQIIPVRRQEMVVSSISNEEYDNLVKERGARGGFGSTG